MGASGSFEWASVPADNEAFRRGIVPADNCVTLDKPEITGAIAAPDPIMRIIKSVMTERVRERQGGRRGGWRTREIGMGALKVNNSEAAWLTPSLIVLQQTSYLVYSLDCVRTFSDKFVISLN